MCICWIFHMTSLLYCSSEYSKVNIHLSWEESLVGWVSSHWAGPILASMFCHLLAEAQKIRKAGGWGGRAQNWACLSVWWSNSCRYTLEQHVQSLCLKQPHSFILFFSRQFLSPFIENLWKSLKTAFAFRCFGLNPLLSFPFEYSCSLFSHRDPPSLFILF